MMLRRDKLTAPMSESGQSRRFDCVPPTSALPPSTDIVSLVRQIRFVPKGDLSKREVHYVSQVVSKNCRPKCPGSAVQHHQQATYHHSRANIPETRPPVIGSKQKRCRENQGIAVIQIALEQMTRTAAEYDLLT